MARRTSRRSARRPAPPEIPGTEYVPEGAPLERPVRGRRTAVVGATLSLIGVIFSVFASLLGAVVLVRVQLESSYTTMKEAFEAGQYSEYALPLIALASQVLWAVLVLIGFLLLAIGLARGYRRAWVWAVGVAGPVGMLLSLALFIAVTASTAPAA